MGNVLNGCGNVLNGCVQCMTYCHDQQQEWISSKDYFDNDDDLNRNNRAGPARNKYYGGYQPSKLKTSSIFVAIRDKNIQEVLRHLKHDEDGNVKSQVNSNHESPLHVACRMGYIDIANILIENGCPANITTRLGTPMHCLIKAVKSGYISSASGLLLLPHLLSAGSDIDGIDDKDQSVLYHAICQSNQDFVDWLITYGASTDLQDSSNGFTALHMAAYVGHIGCLTALLRVEDVAINAVDCQGRTAVVIALLDFLEKVQREPWPNLLYSSSVSYLDPVHQSRSHRMAIVEALLTAGANPNLTDSHGRNPMLIAHGLLALDMTKYGFMMGYPTQNSLSPTSDPSVNSSATFEPKSVQTESMFAPMVRLLVMFGGRFPVGHQQTSFMRYADWMQKLYEDSLGEPPDGAISGRQPPRLVHACRLAIRGHLGKMANLNRIGELPLPEKLLNYVQVTYI